MADILRTPPNQPKRYGASYKSTPLLREGEYVFKAEPFEIPIPTNGSTPSAAYQPIKPGDLEKALTEAQRRQNP